MKIDYPAEILDMATANNTVSRAYVHYDGDSLYAYCWDLNRDGTPVAVWEGREHRWATTAARSPEQWREMLDHIATLLANGWTLNTDEAISAYLERTDPDIVVWIDEVEWISGSGTANRAECRETYPSNDLDELADTIQRDATRDGYYLLHRGYQAASWLLDG